MEHAFEAGADAIVMDVRDHVATALRDAAAGETIRYKAGGREGSVVLTEPVAFGHKIAISAVSAGGEVRKYGEVIGRAVVPIEPGCHVHVHNIEGIRGRGDQAASGRPGGGEA
ncbi:UxaA family hydrolase [Paenibacillus albicereus]|uniref:UxaA family hydrolase n=1 Tax=Paenibacillus albicereus TaxID=2726185 RepID=A0A6H2GZU1_9BACL|nr:UxaA family hydrolase [Paenibacillus albicereus]QJC52686.1 UxaA family hydrolase [Paenibacillus albicereus]